VRIVREGRLSENRPEVFNHLLLHAVGADGSVDARPASSENAEVRLFKRDAELDEAFRLGLDNTSESWKRALVHSAWDSHKTNRRVLLVAALTLFVAAATLIVTLVR